MCLQIMTKYLQWASIRTAKMQSGHFFLGKNKIPWLSLTGWSIYPDESSNIVFISVIKLLKDNVSEFCQMMQ